MACTLCHLLLRVQLLIRLPRELGEFPVAFHAAEFLLRFEQLRGGPASDVVAALGPVIGGAMYGIVQEEFIAEFPQRPL